MASILRFDNWQNSDGTSIATTDASGNISFAGAGAGKILQVVSTTKTDTFSTTVTTVGSEVDITGLSATITPSSTSSKILVMYTVNVSMDSTSYGIAGTLRRDSTDIFIGTESGATNFHSNYLRFWTNDDDVWTYSGQYLDSPATTSSITYKYAIRGVGGGTAYVNRRASATTTTLPSSITAMEVGL